jgi:hypothetical protein
MNGMGGALLPEIDGVLPPRLGVISHLPEQTGCVVQHLTGAIDFRSAALFRGAIKPLGGQIPAVAATGAAPSVIPAAPKGVR